MSGLVTSAEPIPASHPDHLATAAARRGLRSAFPGRCSVLQLACGTGENIIPIAYHLPEARVVGHDRSGPLVPRLPDARAELGLANLEALEGGLEGLQGRRFDYVLLPGVLSWVSEDEASGLLRVCAGAMADDGILFVDHYAHSSRLLSSRLRDLLRRQAGRLPTVAARVERIRATLEALDDASLEEVRHPHTVHARFEVRFLRSLPDASLVQEVLSPFCRGLSPAELSRCAEAVGLRVFDDGWDPSLDHRASNQLEGRIGARLGSSADAGDLVEFITGPRTHTALLCHAPALARADPSSAVTALVEEGEFAGQLKTRNDDVLLDPELEVAFSAQAGAVVRSKDPLTKSTLSVLRDAWPEGRRFGALMTEAIERLRQAAISTEGLGAADFAVRAGELLELHGMGAVRWRSGNTPRATTRAARPSVSPLTAWQARGGPLLTDSDHGVIALDGFALRVVQVLDGRLDEAGLLDVVQRWVEAGELTLTEGTKTSEQGPRERLAKIVARTLDALEDAGLLRG